MLQRTLFCSTSAGLADRVPFKETPVLSDVLRAGPVVTVGVCPAAGFTVTDDRYNTTVNMFRLAQSLLTNIICSRIAFRPDHLDLAGSHKYTIVRLASKICSAIDCPVVLPISFVELNADPFSCSERGCANEAYDALANGYFNYGTELRVHGNQDGVRTAVELFEKLRVFSRFKTRMPPFLALPL